MRLEAFIEELAARADKDRKLIKEIGQKLVDQPDSTIRTMGWRGSDLIELGARLKSAETLLEHLIPAVGLDSEGKLEQVIKHWNEKALHHGSMRHGSTDPICALVERAECVEICQLAKRLKDVKA